MSVEANQLIYIAKQVLRESGITDFKEDIEITYRHKVGAKWRANFTFTRSMEWAKRVGCFSVSIETGEITFSAIDKVWRLGR